jgi:hypothetical protein
MDDLELYMNDLQSVEASKYDRLYLVHTTGYEREDIVVDARTKIADYIAYR